MAHRGDHRVTATGRRLEGWDLRLADEARAKAGELGEADQGRRGRAVTEHEQQGFCHLWLDEDIQRSATRTRRADGELARLPALLHLRVADDAHQARRALVERAQRLAPHHRLRAAAPDPSAQPAVGGNDRLVAGPRGGRRLAANDSGQHAWRAGRGELAKLVEDVVRYSFTPAARRAAQT